VLNSLGWYPQSLEQHHYEMLKASAIDDAVIEARGYRSIGVAEAREMGWSGRFACHGLLIPLHRIDGVIGGYQLRPDNPPQWNDGKQAKYLTLRKQRNVLDVPPTIRDELRKRYSGGAPQTVFITEGAKKGDALASLGIPCITLTGVYNWRGKNSDGGYGPLPDWEEINIKGSQFVIAYDSDSLSNYMVYTAMKRLKRWLEFKQAHHVGILTLPQKGAEKVGVDDWIAQLKRRINDGSTVRNTAH